MMTNEGRGCALGQAGGQTPNPSSSQSLLPLHPRAWWKAAMRADRTRQSSARRTTPASLVLSSTTDTAARVGPHTRPNTSRSSASLAARGGVGWGGWQG